MRRRLRTTTLAALLLLSATRSAAEVLVRWTERDVPARESFGLPTLLVPAASREVVRDALTRGYRVYVELPSSAAASFAPPATGLAGVVVTGPATPALLEGLSQRLGAGNGRVLNVEGRGKWPLIRANWVTRNNAVLQVAGRSAQPWIESNAALIRIANAENQDRRPLLMYDWVRAMEAGGNEGPALENYLVAIAEAGSYGADLVLRLDERFQRALMLGDPGARRDWSDIRRYVEFYSGEPRRYEPIASLGVVTGSPMVWFEVFNLLARHNVPFEVIAPSRLTSRPGSPLPLLLVLDELDAGQAEAVAELERKGSTVRTVKAVSDPNGFALEMRQALGRANREVDIWNGITVLVAPHREAGGDVLLTLVNFAQRALPVQLRVRGTFSRVRYESPEEPAELLAHQSRDGHTEVTVPSVRIGGRVFFSR
jgi:hypothetical protein